MNSERLLKLADFIEKLPPEKLDMKSVVTELKDGCGSVCCAYGWIPMVFPDISEWGSDMDGGYVKIDGEPRGFIPGCPDFFEIEEEDAEDLFGGSRTCSPVSLARDIRIFIATGELPQD